jgi:tRNA U34 5-carboxymethylaminomethyl modifying GTPase MnmE/TrmE
MIGRKKNNRSLETDVAYSTPSSQETIKTTKIIKVSDKSKQNIKNLEKAIEKLQNFENPEIKQDNDMLFSPATQKVETLQQQALLAEPNSLPYQVAKELSNDKDTNNVPNITEDISKNICVLL